ncbi:MAG: DJ-1/PfpI family protein [Chloroflexi bacterium]|uniref:DJ-1/PfpI family protein n=1 Tax=Candidatus Flexifilum breve TaxID=3140694 RepID=UPI003136A90A|nr:DJ-1/PfpI family protein [Chloroflexota bacterium]
MTRNIAILLFETVEVLDFAGPLEVFASVNTVLEANPPFNVYTVAETAGPIRAANPLTIVPDYTIDTCPPPDILIIPGGSGSRKAAKSERLIAWVKAQDQRTEFTLSVCTGTRVLAAAGILDGLQATTHFGSLDELAANNPTITVLRDVRYVDNGHVVTSAGVSAGIDMAFHMVQRLLGEDVARQTARYIEYDYWQPG